MDEPFNATPWKLACAAALALPLVYFGGLAASRGEEPVCVDRTGERGFTEPGFAIIGGERLPACIRDELPTSDR